MDRSNRVRQWYGYTVCLIAVVTALLTLKSVLEHAVDLSNPVLGPDPYGESLVSFEAWKATRGGRFEAPNVKTTADSVPDAVLRQRFIARRGSKARGVRPICFMRQMIECATRISAPPARPEILGCL